MVECPKVMLFWDEVWRLFIRCNVQYRVFELTSAKIMFGDSSEKNNGLNLFLLLAKWFLWKQSKSEGPLSLRLFLAHLNPRPGKEEVDATPLSFFAMHAEL